MMEESPEDGTESGSGRRTFLKTVGVAGAAGLLSGQASADSVDRVVGDGLTTASGRLQEAMIVFADTEGVDRLDEVDLPKGYYAFETLPFAYTELTGDQIREIATWESVMRIVDNREAELLNDDSQEDTNARAVWESEELGYTGENVHAAIIDTGLDGKHPGLLENTASNYQWVGDPLEGDVFWQDVAPGTNDERGHGTHCAGSICGDGDAAVDGDFTGMAPDASITSYGTPLSGLTRVMRAAAYDHIIAGNRQGDHDIRLVSNSWTWGNEFDPWHPIPVAVYWAMQEGVVSLFAAGNSGPDPETLNETKDPFALSAAATRADQSVADFSSRGVPDGEHDRLTTLTNVAELYEKGLDVDEVDGPIRLERPGVAAKGEDVMSTQSPEQAYYALGAIPVSTETGEQTAEPLYGTLSGTSMACPTTAGCTALFLDAYYDEHGEYPNPVDTINTMEATAREAAHEGYNRINVGAGYIDAKAAVEAALEADGLPPGLGDDLPPGLVGDLPPGLARRDPGLPGFDDVDLAEPYQEETGGDGDGSSGEPECTETVDNYHDSGELLVGAAAATGHDEDTTDEFGTQAFAGSDLPCRLMDVRVSVDGPPGFEWTEVDVRHERDGEWVVIGAERFEAAEGELRIIDGAFHSGAEVEAVVDDDETYQIVVRAATQLDSVVTYDVDVEFTAFDTDC